jgi:simple sugar transport system ATP-binding protein
MRNITKRFGSVLANDDVTLTVAAGEIRALVGENGAGKTTLMNILYGVHQPDAGRVEVNGEQARISGPLDAIRLRIGMVHQHFMLAPSLTLAENIVLGEAGRRFAFLERRRLEARVAAVAREHGLEIPVSARARDLPVGVLQRAEIVKALYRGADVLALDEPTAVLTPQESGDLFQTLRALAAQGKTIIFISHKLREVLAVSTRITVMRAGRVTGEIDTSEADEATLARLMIGAALPSRKAPAPASASGARLRIEHLSATGDRGVPALRDVSLEVPPGVIVGVAGVEGNGQTELVEVVTGMRRADAGRVELDGRVLTNASPRAVREAGVAHIPEDRLARGVSPSLSLTDNVLVSVYHRRPFSSRGWLARRQGHAHVDALIARFAVVTPHRRVAAAALSGGNIQKLIVGRELGLEPRVVVASQPTRGVDIGAMDYIHQRLLDLRARGVGTLLVSADLDEILALADRIAVMFEGRIVGEMDRSHATSAVLGDLMAGASRGEAQS